ncbi:MAG: hypothetical protein Q9165_002686 [Trypethelium subeluteriae]
MVSFSEVQSSNSRISSTFPSGLVAIFVGATSGIGEYTLKQFAKYARRPRVYFLGRSQDAGDRIAGECKEVNPEGTYQFIKADVSSICEVDNVCRSVASQEQAINLLFLSQGTLTTQIALCHYSRIRFIINLLPLLQRATHLRRVVSVFAATKEGPVNTADIQGRKVSLMSALSARGHASSLVTLSLEKLAGTAPDVSFVHDFPGAVRTNIARGGGAMMFLLRTASNLVLTFIPNEESGERHLYLATSAKYPASSDTVRTSGIPLASGNTAARGTDGNSGSGVYSIDQDGESASSTTEELLAELRRNGKAKAIWDDLIVEFTRITGAEAM